MVGEIIQPSLYEADLFNNSQAVAKAKLETLGRNLIVAFGITKTILKEAPPEVLKYMFYGVHNLKIPLEKMIIENPGEISAEIFAAGILKKGNAHFSNPNISDDFFELVQYLNSYSYNKEKFTNFVKKFKKYFDSRPGKQIERHKLLGQNIMDRFVSSFFTLYNFSSREKEFGYGFYDRGDKEFHVDEIYKELKRSSDKAKEIARIIL